MWVQVVQVPLKGFLGGIPGYVGILEITILGSRCGA